jgi:maleamate amidohydrolase
MRPWENIIPPEEIEIYQRGGFGTEGGFGERPAIIIIDAQYMATGTKRVPIQQAINEYPHACGEYAWNAIDHIQELLQAARRNGVPTFYPYVAPKLENDLGSKLKSRANNARRLDERAYEIVEEIAPCGDDVAMPKKNASAFFGTPLVTYLIGQSIDTVLMCGCTTSGCVRASTIDAYAYKFKPIVVEQCVWDRSQVSHAVNLFDLDSKYADVRSLTETIAYLDSVGASETFKR